MNDTLDPKEAKILADILALTLDEQPGQALTALQKIQQRARQDGITGGALKNIFRRVSGEAPSIPGAMGGFATAQQRATIAAQAASISMLEQRVAWLQAQLNQTQAKRAEELRTLAGEARRNGTKSALLGLLAGGALAGLVAYSLPSTPRLFIPPRNATVVRPDLHRFVRAPDPGLVPAVRDPADTAPGPEYPPEAARRGAEGVVQLMVYVETDGNVAAIGVTGSSGTPALDLAAEQAVRQWKFKPATRDGVPVANAVPISIRFVLRH